MASITLEQRVADTKGRSTGFDYMRLLLAVSVILWHSFTVSYSNDWAFAVFRTPLRALVGLVLPMFFALSGWLVSGSLFRSPGIATFLGLRVIRIYPALTVEVLLSALTIGPLLTTVALSTYFRDPLFFKYLLNVTGHIHYKLPGLFTANPIPYTVNSQLWTVPWELACYASLTLLAALGIAHKRVLLTVVVSLSALAIFAFVEMRAHGHVDISHGVIGEALLSGFLCAVTLYTWRDKLPWNAWLFAASFILMTVLLLVPGGDYLVGFPAAYATIYLGLLNPPKLGILKGADYSYGLYLYGFVIQQSVANVLPWSREWYLNFPISLLIACLFAAFSWHIIEKPALKLKRLLPHIETRLASLRGRKLKAA